MARGKKAPAPAPEDAQDEPPDQTAVTREEDAPGGAEASPVPEVPANRRAAPMTYEYLHPGRTVAARINNDADQED